MDADAEELGVVGRSLRAAGNITVFITLLSSTMMVKEVMRVF